MPVSMEFAAQPANINEAFEDEIAKLNGGFPAHFNDNALFKLLAAHGFRVTQWTKMHDHESRCVRFKIEGTISERDLCDLRF